MKKLTIGRISVPLWATALGAVGVLAVAGQALGPVLAGSAGGNVGVVASQNIYFEGVNVTKGHDGDIDQAAANIDTAGLILQAAFRMHRGDSPSVLDIDVENRGDNQSSARLTVTRPAGTSVDFSNLSTCGLAQESVNAGSGVEVDSYLLTVPSATCNLHVDVTVGTAEPLGSYDVVVALQEIP